MPTVGTPGTTGNPIITLADPSVYADGKRVTVTRTDAHAATASLTVQATNATIVAPSGMSGTTRTIGDQFQSMTFRLDKPANWETVGARWFVVDRPTVDDMGT